MVHLHSHTLVLQFGAIFVAIIIMSLAQLVCCIVEVDQAADGARCVYWQDTQSLKCRSLETRTVGFPGVRGLGYRTSPELSSG